MAEGIFRQLLVEKGLHSGWRVQSAGTLDIAPMNASENSVKVMADQGIDISRHQSQMVSPELLDEADLILTMAEEHLWLLHDLSPHLASRTFRLSEMTGRHEDVEDPIGQNMTAYRFAAKAIRTYLEDGFDRIVQLAQNPIPEEPGL